MDKKKVVKKKPALCYGDYENKSWQQLDRIHKNIFKMFDKYFKVKSKTATRLEQIEIDGLKHALLELCEVERELTLREEDPR